MASNYAAWLDKVNSPLRVGEALMPEAGPGQVTIRTRAAAINPVDGAVQASGIFVKEWPNIVGCDVAGDIIQVGDGVNNFVVGDRVTSHLTSLLSSNPAEGGFQLYALAQAAVTAKIPPEVSYAQASVLPLALDTAAVGLYKPASESCLGLPFPLLHPKPLGKTIIVWGGSSSVGSMAIQLAVASGASVIATASSHNFDFCQKCGASNVIDYNTPSVVDDVVYAAKAAGGVFAGAYDAIADPDRSYKYILPIMELLGGGNLVTVHKGPEKFPDCVSIGYILGFHEITHPIWIHYLTKALEVGRLICLPEPVVVGSGLESIQRAIDEHKKGVSAKKLVIEL